jgi:hypothetical protein
VIVILVVNGARAPRNYLRTNVHPVSYMVI